MRELVRSRECAEPPVRLEHAIDRVQDGVLVGSWLELHREIVERAFHLVCRRDRILEHPQRSEPRVVRHEQYRIDGKHVLGGQRVPDDQEPAELAVDHGGEVIAGLEAVYLGKRLVHEYFVVASRLEVPSGPKDQTVERSPARRRDRDQVPSCRRNEIVHRQAHLFYDPRVGAGDTGKLGHLSRHGLRRSLEVHEHIGESIRLVVEVAGLIKRPPRAL